MSESRIEVASRTLETQLSLEAPVNGRDGVCHKDQLEDLGSDAFDRLSSTAWLRHPIGSMC